MKTQETRKRWSSWLGCGSPSGVKWGCRCFMPGFAETHSPTCKRFYKVAVAAEMIAVALRETVHKLFTKRLQAKSETYFSDVVLLFVLGRGPLLRDEHETPNTIQQTNRFGRFESFVPPITSAQGISSARDFGGKRKPVRSVPWRCEELVPNQLNGEAPRWSTLEVLLRRISKALQFLICIRWIDIKPEGTTVFLSQGNPTNLVQ